MNYNSKPGETIKMVTMQIKKNLSKEERKEKHKRIEKIKNGKFKSSDLKYLIHGLEFLQRLSRNGIEKIISDLSSNEKETTPEKAKMATGLILANGPIDYFISSYRNSKYMEYCTQREIANLETMYEIIQNSRDGVITKEKIRTEKDADGNNIEVKSNISMDEGEIAHLVSQYTTRLHEIQDRQFSEYIGLGMSVLSLLGAINTARKSENSKGTMSVLGMGSLVSIGTWAGRKYVTKDYNEKVGSNKRIESQLKNDIVQNEPISSEDEEKQIREIESYIVKAGQEEKKIEQKVDIINAIDIISTAIITGNSAIQQLKGKDKMDGEALSKIILNLNQNRQLIRNLMNNIKNIYELENRKKSLEEIEERLAGIISQIEKEQDPLIAVQKPFKKIEIKDLHGKFYPEKNSKTGKINYRHKIEVPEFSANEGEIILLSGKSGRGKSTFIKLLKRGDINNRKSIIIDGKERVDKLGKQFIAIKADRKLGIQTNVLKQLVGKESISELTEEEKEKLLKVLEDVGMNNEKILEELASKNYKQFSTGQQKRLVLSQTLYRTNGEASVLLVDEPVGNVEEELIDEQLRIIYEYAKTSGKITILCTHRFDLAQKYVDRIYNIDENGVLKEVKREEEQR